MSSGARNAGKSLGAAAALALVLCTGTGAPVPAARSATTNCIQQSPSAAVMRSLRAAFKRTRGQPAGRLLPFPQYFRCGSTEIANLAFDPPAGRCLVISPRCRAYIGPPVWRRERGHAWQAIGDTIAPCAQLPPSLQGRLMDCDG